jgi:hypothetical protein
MLAALQTTDVLLEDESDAERAAQMWEPFARQTASVERETSAEQEFTQQVASAHGAIAGQLRIFEDVAQRFAPNSTRQYYNALEDSVEAYNSAIRALQDSALQNAIVSANQANATIKEGEFSITQQEHEMLAKARKLSPEGRDKVIETIDEMLDREDMRRLVREAFEISTSSFARYWGPKSDANPKKSI